MYLWPTLHSVCHLFFMEMIQAIQVLRFHLLEIEKVGYTSDFYFVNLPNKRLLYSVACQLSCNVLNYIFLWTYPFKVSSTDLKHEITYRLFSYSCRTSGLFAGIAMCC